jgi:hypothetical protein
MGLVVRKVPRQWGVYGVYDGACLLGTVIRDPKPARTWRALPSDAGSYLPRTFATRKAAATALVR